MISVTINGERREVPEHLSVAKLLERLDLAGQPLLIEQNQTALLRSEWNEKMVLPGDQLEMIRIVAGG